MAALNHVQYERLERAIVHGTRIAVRRRGGGREYVVVPLRLRVEGNREAIETRNPTTGHELTLYLDEIDTLEVVR